MLLDAANPYTQNVLQQCMTFYTVSQRLEHPTAAAGEEPEVEADLPPLGMAYPTRQLRQGLPRPLKLSERFRGSETCWQVTTHITACSWFFVAQNQWLYLSLACLIKSYQTFGKILGAQLDWPVCLRTTIWTPFLTLFSNRLWEFVSSPTVSDFKTEEQLIWIHAVHAELLLQEQLASMLLPGRKMTPCKYHSTDQPQLQQHKQTLTVTNTCPESSVIHYISQDQAHPQNFGFFPPVAPSSLPFVCQEISSTTSPRWECSKVTSSFLRATSNNELSPAPLIQGMHIFVTTTGLHMCLLQTPENIKCI